MKSKTRWWILWLVVLALIVTSIYYFQILKPGQPSQETIKCIGERSELYVQLGCSHCKTQEMMFGGSYKHLNVVDCFYPGQKEVCIENGIRATPTWIINGEYYEGVQSIERLKELTGC